MLIIISALNFPMLLCDVPQQPVHLSEPTLRDRTIYMPHEYSWWSFHLLASEAVRTYFKALLILTSAFMALATCVFFFGLGSPCHSAPQPWAAALSTWVLVVSIALGRWSATRCLAHGLVAAWIYLEGATVLAFISFLIWTAYFLAVLRCAAWSRNESCEPSETHAVDKMDLLSSASDGEAGLTCNNPWSLWYRRLGWVAAVCCPLLALEEARRTCGSYEAFDADLDHRWGFLLGDGAKEGQTEAAPIWLGEFGVAESSVWWRYMVRYIGEHDVNWAYWPLNGVKTRRELDNYGLLEADGVSVRDPWKLAQLQALGARHYRENAGAHVGVTAGRFGSFVVTP